MTQDQQAVLAEDRERHTRIIAENALPRDPVLVALDRIATFLTAEGMRRSIVDDDICLILRGLHAEMIAQRHAIAALTKAGGSC